MPSGSGNTQLLLLSFQTLAQQYPLGKPLLHYLPIIPDSDTPTPLQCIILAKDSMAGCLKFFSRTGMSNQRHVGTGTVLGYQVPYAHILCQRFEGCLLPGASCTTAPEVLLLSVGGEELWLHLLPHWSIHCPNNFHKTDESSSLLPQAEASE